MEDNKYIRFKLMQFISQTVCKHDDYDKNFQIVQDLLEMVRNGTYLPKSMLEINMLTYLDATSRLPVLGAIESPFLQDISGLVWVQNISASFIWLLCFKSFEHARNVSHILQYNPSGYIGSHVLDTHFFLAEECALKSEKIICLIAKQLFHSEISEIDHILILEPGPNASHLLKFMKFPEYKYLLPIYQIFHFSNINPAYWGGLVWTFLHLMAESFCLYDNYPDLFVTWCNFLLHDLSLCLPCHQCFLHWEQIMEKQGKIISEGTPQTLPMAMNTLHNEISQTLGNAVISWQEYKSDIQPKLQMALKRS
jgi:hypothetical protein